MSLSRQLRRAAERAQRKEECKALKNSLSATKEENALKNSPFSTTPDLSAVGEIETSQEAETGAAVCPRFFNQQNALKNSGTDLSAVDKLDLPDEAETGAAVCPRFFSPDSITDDQPSNRSGIGGPRTPEGKAISSLNNLKHGLTGKFRVLEFESQSDFDAAHDALIAEHEPATPTESELIRRMAEHAWLSRRAQTLQDKALMDGDDKRFSLYMRYQTTNDRGFRACLNDLLRLRREQRLTNRQTERHDARVRLANARIANSETDNDIKNAIFAPLPGPSPSPLDEMEAFFRSALRSRQPLGGGKAAA